MTLKTAKLQTTNGLISEQEMSCAQEPFDYKLKHFKRFFFDINDKIWSLFFFFFKGRAFKEKYEF